MMDLIPENIDIYCQNHSSQQDDVLFALSRETRSKLLYSRMLSGHLQGLLLKFISCMIKPLYILEIGTYTGYSAICLAQGLKDNGTLHTIEKNLELEDIIKKYVKKAGLEMKIELFLGDALNIIPTLNVKYDIVFIDADKENYKNYFDLIIDKVVSGGVIIADNVLWSGKVLEAESHDSETKALAAFNDYIQASEKVENMMLPFRDGLMLMRKK